MVDNHNRGSGEAFRRRQEARKRREPQTIDAKATAINTPALDEAPDVTPAGSGVDEPTPSAVAGDEGRMPTSAETEQPDRPAAPAVVTSPSEVMASKPATWSEAVPPPAGMIASEPTTLPEAVSSSEAASSSETADRPSTGPASATEPSIFDGIPERSSTVAEPSPGSEPSSLTELSAVTERMPDYGRRPAAPGMTDPAMTESSAPPTQAAPEPFRPRVADPGRGSSMLPLALAALAAIVLVGLAALLYGPQLTGSADLAAKVEDLNRRVATLEARPEPAQPTVDVGALQARSDTLDRDLAGLKTALADLDGKLATVTQQGADNTGRIATLEQHAAAAPPPGAPSVAAATTPSPAAVEPGPTPPSPAVPAPATTPDIPAPAASAVPAEPAAPAASAVPPDAVAPSAPAAPATPGDAAAAVPPAPGTLEQPAATPPAAPSSSEAADIVALSGKIEDLSKRLAAVPTEPPPTVDLSPLQSRMADLATRLDADQAALAAIPRVDEAALDRRFTEVDRKLEESGHRVDDLAHALAALPKVDIAPLQASITDIDKRLGPVEIALATPKAGERETEVRAVGSAEETRAAPLAVVAGALARAIEDGRPFSTEVDALHGLGLDDAALGPLPGLAASGVPTVSVLRQRWAAVQTDVLTAGSPKTGDSVLDRFAAGAMNLVQVRQVGAAAGDDPAAVSARIGAALDHGDVAAALTEWAKLPDASRVASQGWADAAHGRLESEATERALMARSIAALAGPTK